MDEFTKFDFNLPGVGLYTSFDDVNGGAVESKYELLPEFVGRGFRIVWQATVRAIKWR